MPALFVILALTDLEDGSAATPLFHQVSLGGLPGLLPPCCCFIKPMSPGALADPELQEKILLYPLALFHALQIR